MSEMKFARLQLQRRFKMQVNATHNMLEECGIAETSEHNFRLMSDTKHLSAPKRHKFASILGSFLQMRRLRMRWRELVQSETKERSSIQRHNYRMGCEVGLSGGVTGPRNPRSTQCPLALWHTSRVQVHPSLLHMRFHLIHYEQTIKVKN